MTTQTSSKPRTVLIAQRLFFISAAIWLIFGIMGISRLLDGGNTPTIALWVIAILMFGNLGAMLAAGLWLGRQSKWAFLFALVVLAANILLTFTDQVGFFDIITALLDFCILGLLLYDRKNYL